MDLAHVVNDIADVIKEIDIAGDRFKDFQPGVGPYGEPQLVKLVATKLSSLPRYGAGVKTKRTPDLLVSGHWALEVKLARPFGDNGRTAENWSVNLLHPYEGNTSLLGDCVKLLASTCQLRKGVIGIGYEHDPPQITLEPLWRGFELLASEVMGVKLGARAMARRTGLIHPVHQQLIVVGWEVLC
jgi:hypothetical protein